MAATKVNLKFTVYPQFDVRPLEAFIAHLRAFAPPPEEPEVSEPVVLPKPKAAPRKAPPKRKAKKPTPARKSTKPEAPAKPGREATCKICGEKFQAKAFGKLPRYCGPCDEELHTPDKADPS